MALLWPFDLFKEIFTLNWLLSSPKWTGEEPDPFFHAFLFAFFWFFCFSNTRSKHLYSLENSWRTTITSERVNALKYLSNITKFEPNNILFHQYYPKFRVLRKSRKKKEKHFHFTFIYDFERICPFSFTIFLFVWVLGKQREKEKLLLFFFLK